MLEPDIIQRIRAIFLHPEPRVTIAEAAGILGWSRAEMDAAIREGEIAVVESRRRKRIEMRELAAWAVQRWAVTTIEAALGDDAARILPPPLRSRRLTYACRAIRSTRCNCSPRTRASRSTRS